MSCGGVDEAGEDVVEMRWGWIRRGDDDGDVDPCTTWRPPIVVEWREKAIERWTTTSDEEAEWYTTHPSPRRDTQAAGRLEVNDNDNNQREGGVDTETQD